MLKTILRLPRKPFLALIWLWQKTLSPDHGFIKILFPYGYCKFQPSCSTYGYEAIDRYGVIRGVPMMLWRILRCNPFSAGGDDPVIKT
jgi:putative membrane protein insertion efficiency factor